MHQFHVFSRIRQVGLHAGLLSCNKLIRIRIIPVFCCFFQKGLNAFFSLLNDHLLDAEHVKAGNNCIQALFRRKNRHFNPFHVEISILF